MRKQNKLFKKFILWYLKKAAKIQIFKIKPKIIGVGGSSGKTSLANFIFLILKEKYKALETKGKNSESGIPLSILKIKMTNYKPLNWFKALLIAKARVLFDFEKLDFLVCEMGIDSPFEPKNMSYLLKIISPQIGVLTNISLEHSENFDPLIKGNKDREKKILDLTTREEMLLLSSISEEGTAVINLDDQIISDNQNQILARKITVSKKFKDANFYITGIKSNLFEFKVNFTFTNEKYSLALKNPLPDHYAYSLVLAIAVCFTCGVSVEHSISILKENFTLPPGRFTIFKGIKNTTLIDSSYNSSLSPLKDALSLLKKISENRRKVAILGDIRELGTQTRNIHEKVALEITENSDFAILIGPNLKNFTSPILESKQFPFKNFNNFKEASEFILKSIKNQDIILVKGSQNTLFLERVVEMLLKNPEDKDKLCRRGAFWNRKREMGQ
ncbi:MAG: hypothetical protein A2W22_03670 [Candidatus Levybacteria bacterium RBG_16_35_11]|nr:MAG: hypothetical protein A2W22_03670 [Candidatus Levybacteria bacterium RBG_16_35_11]